VRAPVDVPGGRSPVHAVNEADGREAVGGAQLLAVSGPYVVVADVVRA